MIVLVDEEGNVGGGAGGQGRRFRNAPPVASNINGKEWDHGYGGREKGRNQRLNAYDAEDARRGGGGAPREREGGPREKDPYPYHGISRDNSYVAHGGGGRRDRSTSGYSYSSGGAVARSANESEFSFQLK